MTRAPVIALSHGGGPLPILGDPAHAAITQSLKTRAPDILRLNTPNKPRAIIVVTAHWSERVPHISSGETHSLYFDYSNFPPETYKYKYNASGSPSIAEEIATAMRAEGLAPQLDAERGWDHGVFIPMLLIHPAADVPIVQVSVLDSEDPAEHFKMGRALQTLRDDNVAIVGSGFASFHNLRLQFTPGAISNPEFLKKQTVDWSGALGDAVQEPDVDVRGKKFEGWRGWPGAYAMHPQHGAEHFLPLVVCAGAAGEGKAKGYKDEFRGMDIWSYYWD